MVQSEVGDYDGPEGEDEDESQDENTAAEAELDGEHAGQRPHQHPAPDTEYLKKFPFCKNKETDELLLKIAKHHRKLRGASRAHIHLPIVYSFHGIKL